MEPAQRIGEHAIVIGASMAGLLAARVLADRVARVTIVERDALPPGAEARKGVPQARHAHALLGGGREALETLFPGFTDALVVRGALRGSGRFFSGGGYHQRTQRGLGALYASRLLLEAEVRARVLALPNVRALDRCEVAGVVASDDRARVTGVRLARRDGSMGEELLTADLVVDASGRGSQVPVWLEGLGYARPEVELVEVKMGYSSRVYRRDPAHLGGDLMINVAPTPANPRACGMLAQEDGRWIVTLAGYFGDFPPTDEVGYLDYARKLPVPDAYDLIRAATPLSDPIPFRFPANQWRHYERLAHFPEGLLVIGDAIASFTPIYGQGMTVAALEAMALRDCLAQGRVGLARRYFARASQTIAVAWGITVGGDRALTGASADLPRIKRAIGWYMGKLQIAARHDEAVAFAFQQVGSLLAAPPSLLRPNIALRVLWGNLRLARRQRGETVRRDTLSSSSQV